MEKMNLYRLLVKTSNEVISANLESINKYIRTSIPFFLIRVYFQYTCNKCIFLQRKIFYFIFKPINAM